MIITSGSSVVFRTSFINKLSEVGVKRLANLVMIVSDVRETKTHTAPNARTKKPGKWITKREVCVIFDDNGEIFSEWYPLSVVKIAR